MGKLSIVATPIGNLEDITLRALRTLKECDAILCEDTRVTKKLLSHYGIHTPTMPFHAHSAKSAFEKIVELLKVGKHLALVTDAGTPAISDPGAYLVETVRRESPNTTIEAIPGASSVSAALSIAGVPSDSYTFLGFLPHKKGRKTMLDTLTQLEGTVIMFESPHRIKKLIDEVAARTPNRTVTLCRELTKKFEEVRSGTATELASRIGSGIPTRGEFVVILSP
ncbi:MAG: 16S rRNA (cytidine(1402)-2'-O)-methyltransferase [Patescibacteria group bacterium]